MSETLELTSFQKKQIKKAAENPEQATAILAILQKCSDTAEKTFCASLYEEGKESILSHEREQCRYAIKQVTEIINATSSFNAKGANDNRTAPVSEVA